MNVFTEVLNSKLDTNRIGIHDDCYSYYDSYGAYKNIDSLPEIIPANTYFYRCPFLQFGDYDNSCAVERANVREWLEMYKEYEGILFHHVTGAYSSESIYIDITCTNPDIIETLNALFDYPAINDETVSTIEAEIEGQSWDNVYKSELLDAIKKKFNAWDIECNDDQKLYELYRALCEKTNTYFEVQSGGNGWIDIKRIAAAIDTVPDFITLEYNY